MKYIKILFSSIIFLIILFFFSFSIFNNEEISNLERRNLTTFPKFNINKIFDKEYYDRITNAFSDQLELRNYLVKGYYLFQFQRYNGDVVIGNNNQLYAAYQTINNNYYDNLKELVSLINEVADDVTNIGAKFIFLAIPRKDAVLIKDLPKTYPSSRYIYLKSSQIMKENLNSNVNYIDAYDIFTNNEYISSYYNNDHHITPRGGQLLYTEIIKYVENFDGIKLYNLDNTYYVNKTVINGSFNRQIGQSANTVEEELYLTPKININYTRYENNKLSNLKIWGSGNTYEEAFMEGDMAFTIVDTNRNELPNILYVGSSFTNILEALSVPSFNKMISIDYRHNKTGKSIKDYVKDYNIDYVVFAPSQSTNAFSISQIKEHLGK